MGVIACPYPNLCFPLLVKGPQGEILEIQREILSAKWPNAWLAVASRRINKTKSRSTVSSFIVYKSTTMQAMT